MQQRAVGGRHGRYLESLTSLSEIELRQWMHTDFKRLGLKHF